jgi:signal peptidase I
LTEGNALSTIIKVQLLKRLWKNEYFQTVVVIGLIVLTVLGFWYGSQLVLNTQYPVLAVVTGSMCVPFDGGCDGVSHPFDRTLHVGDLIIVQGVNPADLSDDYPDSDIIVFHKPGNPDELIVHRIVAINEVGGVLYFRTKGDGNGVNTWPDIPQTNEYDPWQEPGNSFPGVSEDNVAGRVIMRVPYIGHVVLFMRNSVGLIIVVALVILLIIAEFLVPLLRGRARPESKVAGTVEYVKGSDQDDWHWCRNCTQYPVFIYDRQSDRPRSRICPQCKAREDNHDCIM